MNASVEFDMARLAPTYRLMWGSAGESNALAVARGLGFDPLVVDEAERLVTESLFALKSASTASSWLDSCSLWPPACVVVGHVVFSCLTGLGIARASASSATKRADVCILVRGVLCVSVCKHTRVLRP